MSYSPGFTQFRNYATREALHVTLTLGIVPGFRSQGRPASYGTNQHRSLLVAALPVCRTEPTKTGTAESVFLRAAKVAHETRGCRIGQLISGVSGALGSIADAYYGKGMYEDTLCYGE